MTDEPVININVDLKLSGCPHCGRTGPVEANSGADGFTLRLVNAGIKTGFWISCPCGMITRIATTIGELRTIWNSRRNKPWTEPEISVKHAGPRGAEPGTVSSKEIQDAF